MWTAAVALLVAPPLLLRRSAIDLTPPELLPLGGYTARGGKAMDPGGEPLSAHTTVLQRGEERWAVVSLEMLTVPESLEREVRRRVGVPLFLIATHTHCAPDSQMLNDRMTFSIPGIASFRSRWLEWYADRIAVGIQRAFSAPPVSADQLSIHVRHLPLNRARRQGAQPDETATLIAAGGRPLWLHYAAHAVFWGSERNQTSGDWPGAIARRLGADVLTGAIGDVSPRADGDSPSARIASFAETVGSAFPGNGVPLSSAPLTWIETGLPLGSVTAHPEFARANRIPEPLAQSLAQKFAPSEAKITAFRIGKLAIVGIPGEPTSELGRAIRDYGRRIGFSWVLVCSHVNGWIGYILTASDYARGGYEATLAMHGPGQGERTVRAACHALDLLAAR